MQFFEFNRESAAGSGGAGRPCQGPKIGTGDGVHYTMVDAVQQYVSATTFAQGVAGVAGNDTSGIASAVALARASAATVLVVGTDLGTAHEGHDATDLALSPAQLQLVAAVAAAGASKPLVVVVMSAVPLDLSALLTNTNVGAILYVGQPSVQCLGVGDVLFGKLSPGGRMVQTLYPVSVQHELSIFDMNMRPGPSKFPRPDGQGCKPGTKTVPCSKGTGTGTCTPDVGCVMGTNAGRTHRFYTGKAIVPFGFGLSYSSFSYDLASAPPPAASGAAVVSLAPVRALLASTKASNATFPSMLASQAAHAAPVKYTINVTNTGSVDADDVVLGFLTPPNAGVDGVPLQALFGFERVFVRAGQSVSVQLYPELTQFTQVATDGTRAALAGEYGVHFGLRESASLGMGFAEHRFTMAA